MAIQKTRTTELQSGIWLEYCSILSFMLIFKSLNACATVVVESQPQANGYPTITREKATNS